MHLLADISKEQDRITANGQKAVVVWMSHSTRQEFDRECMVRLGHMCKKIYGMQVREDPSLPFGVVRLSVDEDTALEFPF